MLITKCVNQPGGKPFRPELESQLVSWITKKGKRVWKISGSMIRLEAKVFKAEMAINDFHGVLPGATGFNSGSEGGSMEPPLHHIGCIN